TETDEMVSALLSPPAVLFHVAVTVLPILKAPPVPVAPLMLILGSVTVGAILSTVALVVSAVVVLLPALSVTDTDTLRFVVSMEPTMVEVASQFWELLVATPAELPPNCTRPSFAGLDAAGTLLALLSPPAVLFHVAVTVSPI